MEILDRHRRGRGYRGGVAHWALCLCAQLVVETIPARHGRFWVMATLVRLHHHASRKTDVRARRPRLPDWCLGGFCISYSLAFNWLSSYCWFSPRYAFFSGPVLREMGLIVALNAAIAFFGAYLMGGNWRTAMGLFVFASYVLIRLMH
jgi:hypothetical protein